MSVPIAADQLSISADDPEARDAIVRQLVNAHIGFVVTITTRHLDQRQLTLLPRDPGQSPDVAHGAAFVDDPRHELPLALPIILLADIAHVYID